MFTSRVNRSHSGSFTEPDGSMRMLTRRTVNDFVPLNPCCQQRRQVCSQPPTSALNVTLLAVAAEHFAAEPLPAAERQRLLSIDICCPRGARQQLTESFLA